MGLRIVFAMPSTAAPMKYAQKPLIVTLPQRASAIQRAAALTNKASPREMTQRMFARTFRYRRGQNVLPEHGVLEGPGGKREDGDKGPAGVGRSDVTAEEMPTGVREP